MTRFSRGEIRAPRRGGTPAIPAAVMEREIQREYEQIKDLVYGDTQKPFTNEQFEQEVETLKAFARERPPFVEAEVAKVRP